MGISEGAFWNMNITRLRPYIIAENIRSERDDLNAWLHGAYVAKALEAVLGSMLGSETEYPPAPLLSNKTYTKTEEEKLAKEQELERLKLVARLDSFAAYMRSQEKGADDVG